MLSYGNLRLRLTQAFFPYTRNGFRIVFNYGQWIFMYHGSLDVLEMIIVSKVGNLYVAHQSDMRNNH